MTASLRRRRKRAALARSVAFQPRPDLPVLAPIGVELCPVCHGTVGQPSPSCPDKHRHTLTRPE